MSLDTPEASARPTSGAPPPGGDFRLLVQKLGYQALIGLGVLENPVTGTQDRNVEHARAVLEDLRMLRAKTRGNLDEHEEAHLVAVIDNLGRHLGETGSARQAR